MIIEQLYTNCLAQGAYYIQSDGECAIIDPLREYSTYIDLAKKNNAEIKYIFETHFHADFVSGHLDLSKKTGAEIIFGPSAETSFKSTIAADGQEFKIGKLTIKTLHTPGHTLESTCFLLLNENKKPICIFTGDTLFIGDVGRPDLAIKSDLTQEDLAGMLFNSLRKKIMTLPNDVIIYPAHGAGSACGKNMSKETFDTLGNQKKLNYALANLTKEEFIKELNQPIILLTPVGREQETVIRLSRVGYDNCLGFINGGIEEWKKQGNNTESINSISAPDFSEKFNTSVLNVLDVRKPGEYESNHIDNVFSNPLDFIEQWQNNLSKDKEYHIHCAGGYRSMIAASLLKRLGYVNLIDVSGGFAAISNTNIKMTSKACSK
jgi:glyoxylase-like metal-dependent hydrolase (beta-lactamase superfamily II)/rhodanese-related sulfurtransferase